MKAPRTDDPKNFQDVLLVSARNLTWLWDRALEVDRQKMAQLRDVNRATPIAGYLAECLYGR